MIDAAIYVVGLQAYCPGDDFVYVVGLQANCPGGNGSPGRGNQSGGL